jgi:hypothetical protein
VKTGTPSKGFRGSPNESTSELSSPSDELEKGIVSQTVSVECSASPYSACSSGDLLGADDEVALRAELGALRGGEERMEPDLPGSEATAAASEGNIQSSK